MMGIFMSLCHQHMLLAWRSGHTTLIVSFLFIAITLMPFGLGPELALLRKLAPGLLWVVMLMSLLLSLDRMFQADFEDGTFDQLALLPMPMELIVLAKSLGHFLALFVPLLICVPVAGLLLNIDASSLPVLMLTMLMGAPALTLLGAIGAALALSIRRSAMLTVLLVMPLYVPVLIFGATGSSRAISSGGEIELATLGILALMSLAALFMAPLAAAAALRVALR
jgi:heme exporter protein B